jgi:hypothetical protein
VATFPHVRLVASGTLGTAGGNEIWSCGLKVVVADPGDISVPLAPTSSDLTQLATVGLVGWGNLLGNQVSGSLFSSDINLTACKASAVAANGKDDPLVSSVIADALTQLRGTVSPGVLPYSVAIAVTLTGATWKRGAAAHGRFYLPKPDGMGDLVNGTMPPAKTTAFARQAGKLLDHINSVGTGNPAGQLLTSGRVVMVSNISTSAAASGLRWQNVNAVAVDSRPDTIRRRSNKLGGLASTIVPLPVPA